jgi:CubicO group peptidase (beta-lactamase class C family)
MRRIRLALAITISLTAIQLFIDIRSSAQVRSSEYFPPRDTWERRKPAEVGMDAAKLNEAIEFMKSHETAAPARDFSDQEIIFGKLLGSMPTERGATNGLIIRHGFVVAEFGDTLRPDPTYSVAKSMLSTVAGIALGRGLISNVDDPVAKLVKDGGYDSPHNRLITWRNHLQQESEWEGEMWGKNSNFLGTESFGRGEMKPRAIQEPGAFYEYNDVRINRFALSLLKVFKKPIPDVFRDEVMNPIGASTTWKWVPYANAYVDIDSKRMPSVSGGTRWGGGVWISSYDLARFGLLWLRGGKWGDRQIVSPAYARMATTPSAHGPDYGFLWWLNSKQRQWPDSPKDAYWALGSGGNYVYVAPTHDLVVVWRWSAQSSEGFRKVVAAITN